MHETLIRAATVVDGTEAPGYTADVAIAGGVITAIGADLGPAHRVIDADGLVLSPGFIDMHAHSDLQVLLNPAHPSRITQGVTCEVIGQDGLSYAPVSDETLAVVRRQIAGWNTDPADFDFSWRTVGEYLDRLDAAGTATNLAYLVPHGLLRALTIGFGDGVASPAEVARMQEILTQGLSEGAVGLSTGLTYTPAMYADDAELAALMRTTGELGGYFSPHHRSYGAGAMEAYAEMIDLSRRTGCPLHLAHATLNFGPTRDARPSSSRCSTMPSPPARTSRSTPIPTCPAPPRSRRSCRAGRHPAAPVRRWRGCATRNRWRASGNTSSTPGPTAATA